MNRNRQYFDSKKFVCDPCKLEFPSAAHRGAHKRYTHGAGLRRNPAPEPPKPSTPACFSPTAVPVPPAAIALPWIAFPRDSASCASIASWARELATGRGDEAMSDAERKFWETLAAHVAALPAVRDRELTLQEQATREKIRARRFA